MANKIVLKKSSVAGKVPLSTDLEIGELAVNLADAKLYSKDAGGTVIAVGGGGSGGGNVVGPSSATDNAIARYDGTTGKLIQNSTVTVDDSGNTSGINAVTFDTTPSTTPTTEGTLFWDSADGNQTLSLVMAGGNAIQQIGEEQYYRIKASAPITEGQVVMFTGTVGASGGLTGAPATGLTAATASYVMGIATQNFATNDWGYVTSFGLVRNIDTSAFTSGAILYLNPSVAGGLTTTIPTAPNPKVQVCACVYASASNGSLFVRPSFGGILGQYEGDVNISSAVGGEILSYDGATSTWKNTNAIVANTSSDALRITQTGSGNALVVEDSSNPDSTAFVITNNGNVIQGGTTSFNTGTAAEPWFAITSPNIYGPQLIVDNTSNDATAGYTNFRKSRNGAVVQSGDTLGTYVYQGFDGTNYINAAEIAIKVDGTPGTNDMPGRIIFATTASGASSSTERMRIDNAGNVGIGGAAVAGRSIDNPKNMTGGTTAIGLFNRGVIQSDVTINAYYFSSQASTAAASFTVGALRHFSAIQGTVGSGSNITSQFGFIADSSLTGATNNYGFYSNLSVGTGRYNFYAPGSAANYFAGNVGIGTLPVTGQFLKVGGLVTGAASGYSILNQPTIASDVTTLGVGLQSQVNVASAAFTCSAIRAQTSLSGTLGSGSIVSTLYGYYADPTLTTASNNYGFYSNINAVSSGGTATSSVSTVSSSGTTVTVVTAAAHGLSTNQVVTIPLTANATALASGVTCTILTVGTTDFTLIGAANNNVGTSFTATGAGTGTGTVTLNQQNSGKTITVTNTTTFTYTAGSSATFSAITASGTVTPSTRWNFYGSGTAPNFFNGNVGIGASPTVPLTVQGATAASGSLSNVAIIKSSAADTTTYYNSTKLALQNTNSTSGTMAYLGFVAQGGNDYASVLGTCTTHTNGSAVGYLSLGTNNGSGSTTERMRITAAGGVSFGSSGTAYGTTGQVLTSNGDAPPSWQAAASGGSLLRVTTFTTSGTWTKGTGTTKILVQVVGAGGGGGGIFGGGGGGGGGGAGGYSEKLIDVSAVTTVSATIGTGGNGGNGAAGSNGGNTTFGAYITCNGGVGGNIASGGPTYAPAGAGGTATGGDINMQGGSGQWGVYSSGYGIYISGNGGASYFGGGTMSTATYTGAATCYGAGGGGATSTSSPGNTGTKGAGGIVIVWEFA